MGRFVILVCMIRCSYSWVGCSAAWCLLVIPRLLEHKIDGRVSLD
jgi:hypothetical protein